MGSIGVEDLEIYKIAYTLMLKIHKESLKFPKIEQYNGIADQLRRSSKSITANIVEGFAKQKFYKDEFKKMLVYAIGSCDETILWIKVAKDLKYISNEESKNYLENYKKLVKKISRFVSNMKNS